MGCRPGAAGMLLPSEVVAVPAWASAGSEGGRSDVLWLPSPEHLPWDLTGAQNPPVALDF